MLVLMAASASAGYCKDTVTNVCRESVVCLQYDTLAECQGGIKCWCPLAYRSCSNLQGAVCSDTCFKYDDPLNSASSRLLCESYSAQLYTALDDEPADFYSVCSDPGESCQSYACCRGLSCVRGKCVDSNFLTDMVDNDYMSADNIPNYDPSDYSDSRGCASGDYLCQFTEVFSSALSGTAKVVGILQLIVVLLVVLAFLPLVFIAVGVMGSVVAMLKRLFR